MEQQKRLTVLVRCGCGALCRLAAAKERLWPYCRRALPHVRSRAALGARYRALVLVTMLHVSDDIGADLIVAGAYGHSRAREMVFGGVTRTLIAEMTAPVRFSH